MLVGNGRQLGDEIRLQLFEKVLLAARRLLAGQVYEPVEFADALPES